MLATFNRQRLTLRQCFSSSGARGEASERAREARWTFTSRVKMIDRGRGRRGWPRLTAPIVLEKIDGRLTVGRLIILTRVGKVHRDRDNRLTVNFSFFFGLAQCVSLHLPREESNKSTVVITLCSIQRFVCCIMFPFQHRHLYVKVASI